MENIKRLRAYVKESIDSSITEFLFFKYGENDVGLIYCDPNSFANDLDNHCEACREEILPFALHGPDSILPRYIVICVGSDKFKRIKEGWRGSTGFNLSSVEFI